MERALGAVKLKVASLELFERDVRLRMPFRFGVVTLTESPQAFVRARIRIEDGREAEGAAAELLAPKWFDKDPALTNADNVEQLRRNAESQQRRVFGRRCEVDDDVVLARIRDNEVVASDVDHVVADLHSLSARRFHPK